jgi:hypothetical protein
MLLLQSRVMRRLRRHAHVRDEKEEEDLMRLLNVIHEHFPSSRSFFCVKDGIILLA